MRHQLVLVLASGGMGMVQLVLRQEGAFRRLVALKRPLTAHPEARSMFLEEARVAGLIRHANAVSVLDVGEDEEGPFLVMDYVDGPSLSLLLSHGEGFLPVQVVLDIARQVAAGLHAAHELRTPEGERLELVHRDVSPANILLGFDGVVRLTDFGIARASGRVSDQTAEGVLKGKMGYMAPELLRFEEATVQSDLFAFGVVLFEMLAGRRLYGGQGRSAGVIARAILEDAPPDVGYERSIPPEIDALLFELLAKDPKDRPQNAASVAERIDEAWTELVTIEGRAPLEALLMLHFADARAEREKAIERAMAAPTNSPTSRPKPSSDLDMGKRAPKRWLVSALFVVAALFVVSAFVWQSTGENESVREDRTAPELPNTSQAVPVVVDEPAHMDSSAAHMVPSAAERNLQLGLENTPVESATMDETKPTENMRENATRMRQPSRMRPFGTWGWK